jgi:malate synthase
MAYQQRAGLKVDLRLDDFIELECLEGSGLSADAFWRGLAKILADFTPANRALLAARDALQAKIDAWHDARQGRAIDLAEYQRFLREIGYLVDEPPPFKIGTSNVDPEIATMAGPQLVVPSRNARFALNAANARWGSLYDALYGTDALPGRAAPGGYDKARGGAVIAWASRFLDDAAPLQQGRHADVAAYAIAGGVLAPPLKNPAQFAGYRGAPEAPTSVLLKNNGLHIEIAIDRANPIGRAHKAGVADVILESALTTIIDLEDSIAAVDADDKVEAYANWLGLMKGTLEASFAKGASLVRRTLDADREFKSPGGGALMLPGRSVLLVRNVGHLMTTPAILLASSPASSAASICAAPAAL